MDTQVSGDPGHRRDAGIQGLQLALEGARKGECDIDCFFGTVGVNPDIRVLDVGGITRVGADALPSALRAAEPQAVRLQKEINCIKLQKYESYNIQRGLTPRKLIEIHKIVEEHENEIIEAWQRHFGKR